jgi:hypothetical protein
MDPLTGLKVADPSILERRPVLVKVANYPRWGRPHAGLTQADIVFDYYTGVGTNRFLALYYGQNSDKIGPVRSGRYVDRWLVNMYGGILGMVSAYAPVLQSIIGTLGNRLVNLGTNTCPALCRLEDNEAGVFANSAEMSNYYAAKSTATNVRQNLDGMAFNHVPPEGGQDAAEFTMQTTTKNLGNWRYDQATQKYLRWIEDEKDTGEIYLMPLVDRNTNQQLAFSNVIVIFSQIETLNHDDSLHEIHVLGKGSALIFRDGKMYDVTYKATEFAPIQFLDANGNPFLLQPGNTWIHITGTTSDLSEDSSGVWRVILGVP